MYTRCPSCSATFRVTAAVLQMAGGDVRCGACGAVFNALQTLVDDWTGTHPALAGALPASRHDSPPREDDAGDEPGDEPGPADEPGNEPDAWPAGPDAAIAPDSADAAPGADGPDPGRLPDVTLEFDVPENEWQKFFISAQPPAQANAQADGRATARAEPALGAAFAALDPPAAGGPSLDAGAPPAPPRSIEEETADTGTWRAFLAEAIAPPPGDGPDDRPDGDPDDDPDDGARDAADDAPPEPLFVLGEDAGSTATVLVRRPTLTEPLPGEAREPGALPGPGATADTDPLGPAAPDAGPPWDDALAAEAPAPAPALAPAPAPTAADAATRADGTTGNDEPTGDEPGPAHDDTLDAAPLPHRATGPGTVLDWSPAPGFPERAPAPPAHGGRWFAASLVAALALGAQFLHDSRDALAANPRWGAVTRAAYGRLGLPLHPRWPLDAYEIRGAKAIADNTAQGALDIVAEIAVNGDQPVGAPVVRVVLRDRWSNTVASGTFGPEDYLAEAPPPGGTYPPGSLIPVAISLADPGTAAQGYELDVCMPNRQLGLQCKTARDPFRR